MVVTGTVIFLFVFLIREICCLRDVVLDIEPRVVEYGKESTLRCSYNLENAPLYTVKWYRGQHEFYRFTPKEHPFTKIFPFEGMHIDVKICCLRDVVLDIEPRVVEYGKESTLRCSYNLENAPLYTVKWYRGQHEFYRFTPKEHPFTKIFPFEGMHIDDSKSNEHQVVLRNIGFNLSGNFSCEVTTDEPSFAATTVIKDMVVVVLPKSPPSLTTDKSFYEVGDVLRANCSSPQSRPAATLTFILNNIVVCEKCITRKHPHKEMFRTESFLELPLFPSHFHNGRLTLKCVAQIGDLYQQDTDITFTNVKDPIPARATLPLFSSHFHNGRLTLKCVAQIGDLYQQDTDITFTNVKDPIPAPVTQTSSNDVSTLHSSYVSTIISIIIFNLL